jgi:NADPH2:quinone reductase
MKATAIVMLKTGGPEQLGPEEVDVGEPGENEVLLRHTAIGVNFAETQFRRGIRKMPLPGIPGGEAAGIVERVGAAVTAFKPGDRVAYCGALGSYATHRTIPSGALMPIPDNISDEIAAASLLKGLTAWYLIFRTVPIKAGDKILYHAAAGGVGTILCQWAKHLGAFVIGTVGSEEKKQRALANGCDVAIDYRTADFVAETMAATGGVGVHVCYDSVALDTFEDSMKTLAPGGYLVLFGNASGDVDPMSYSRIPLDRYFIHPTLPHYIGVAEERNAAARTLFNAVERGIVSVDVPQTYPLTEAARAHEDLESRHTVGSSVLLP